MASVASVANIVASTASTAGIARVAEKRAKCGKCHIFKIREIGVDRETKEELRNVPEGGVGVHGGEDAVQQRPARVGGAQ